VATVRWLANRYLHIDPRSLGLFRILFGLALIGDLCRRWTWLTAFYSNDGVLPNHNHLFNLRESGRVWSALHAFSHRDEAFTAFAIILVFYLFFTVGVFTRVAAVVSAIGLVSLAGRNILTNGLGDSLAIMVLLSAVFLPLGTRFSLDALRRSFAQVDEHDAAALNDRDRPSPATTRPSLAALVILVVLGLVPLAAALQQNGAAWSSGEALHYALRSDRWLSSCGEFVRNTIPGGVLVAWTKLLRLASFLVLPLALVPVARRVTRPLAMGALGLVGLTYAICFELGAYGSTLVAGVALLIPEELWDGLRTGTRPIRVVYDDDCGMCLWLARLLKRLDLRRNVTFVGNGTVAEGTASELPADVTLELVSRTIVVIDTENTTHVDAAALARILRALPLLGWLGHLVALPGLSGLVAKLYYRVAERRLDISVACGLGACGLPREGQDASAPPSDPEAVGLPPATRLVRGAALMLETLLVGALFATFLAATDANNSLPLRSGLGNKDALLGAASYARIVAPWGVFAPEPPRRNEALVTIGTTRENQEVDVLNGLEADLDLAIPSRHRLGPMWAMYGENLRREEMVSFRQELRRYLMRGGKIADDREQAVGMTKLKAYWVSAPIAPPGGTAEGEIERFDLLDNPALPRPSQVQNLEFGRLPGLRAPTKSAR
jgi:predicted DCC family thiol-disulfide oxidoreductase YuxK